MDGTNPQNFDGLLGRPFARRDSSEREPSKGRIQLSGHARLVDCAHALPMTPPPADSDRDPDAEQILSTATHVLSTEATALSYLSRLYATDTLCRDGFVRAVDKIADSQRAGGKTIVIGVGKSGKIGDKLVASMNSMGLLTTFLNPVDALHGDLGVIRKNDVLLLITFSGKTPEQLQLLPHLPTSLPLIALTAHTSYHTSPLTRGRENAILLPAPIPESEVASFGLAAPTTSTTVAMALGDALSLSAAARVHHAQGTSPREVFKRNHPGGAIGQVNKSQGEPGAEAVGTLAVSWDDMHIIETIRPPVLPPTPAMSDTSSDSDVDLAEWNVTSDEPKTGVSEKPMTVLDCLRVAVKSPNGWLTTRDGGVISPKKLMSVTDVDADIYSPEHNLVVDLSEQFRVSADWTINHVAAELRVRAGRGELANGSVVAVVAQDGKITGAIEVDEVLKRAKGY